MEACTHGNLEMVNSLSKQPDVDIRYFNDEALFAAVSEGHLHIIQWFFIRLQSDTSVRLQSDIQSSNTNPVDVYELADLACNRGYLSLLKWFALHGVNVHRHNWVLREAVICGHVSIVEWLGIQNDYNVFLKVACQYGRLRFVKWLVANGANINYVGEQSQHHKALLGDVLYESVINKSPIQCAGEHPYVMLWLYLNGADKTLLNGYPQQILDTIMTVLYVCHSSKLDNICIRKILSFVFDDSWDASL
jgi:hypothetical protein